MCVAFRELYIFMNMKGKSEIWSVFHSKIKNLEYLKTLQLSSVVFVVQLLSCVQLFATPLWQHATPPCPPLSPRVCPSIQPSHPLLPPSSHAINISQHQDFSTELAVCITWPKYWSFSFGISPSSEYWGLISFRIDWFDLLAVQGTLKSFLLHHNLKASIFWCSACSMAQLSHPYMTTGKIIALTRRTFVGKVMSLLFNMLSRLVLAFLPRSTHLWPSWLQSRSTLICCPTN